MLTKEGMPSQSLTQIGKIPQKVPGKESGPSLSQSQRKSSTDAKYRIGKRDLANLYTPSGQPRFASAETAAEANQSATEREKLTGDPPKTPEEWKEHRAILEGLVRARHGRFKIFDETYCGIRPVALPCMSRKDFQVTDRHLRT